MTEVAARTLNASHVAGRAHDILLVALIALRPLVWSGQAGAWDNLGWLLLALGALAWLVIDAWRGRVPAWRFGVGGVLAMALLLILLPAALRSPYPSTGMGLWGMAVIHLGFAAYLMQVVPGRERLAFGALAGALTVECLIALGQWAWVLPKMAAALAGGDPAIAALENANGDLANRVAYGGLFGTFTLANTLAAFLLLAAVPFLGVASVGRGSQRLIAGVMIVIALIVALGTASKGAAVALALAGVLVWTMHVTGRLRWVALIGMVIGSIVIAVVPQVRDLGAASAKVRLGYWEGAAVLVAEAPLLGHGLNGFAAHGTRTMPLDAEPTRHVHNDVLEATVDGGVLAGLAMLALIAWCARRRPDVPALAVDGPDTVKRTWQAAWPLLLFFPVFSALGMLASNLEWWPLGAGEMTWWLWPLILSGVAIVVALLSARLPLPPAWAWQLALAAFALHCLVDFNLQSPAIWGTVIIVAVLAGGRVYAVGVCNISRSVVTLLVAGLATGWVMGVRHDATTKGLVPSPKLLADLRGVEAKSSAPFSLHDRWKPSPSEHRARLIEGLAPILLTLSKTWPNNVELHPEIMAIFPPGAERLPISRHLSESQTWNAQAQEWLAQDLAATGRWDEAVTTLTQAVALNPAYLPRRQRLIDLLVRAARAMPSQASTLFAEAERESQRLAELAPVVHLRNRLPQTTDSGLPVQPTP